MKSECEHIVYGPLLAAKEEHEFTWNEAFDGDTSPKGAKNHLYMAFYRLRAVAVRSREELLKNTAKTAVKKIIDYIEHEKKVDVSHLRALAAGKSAVGKTPVDIYVKHIDLRIRAANDDPILKRVALEAQARAFELERKWAVAGTTLESIVKIEAENLCDPVEAARTSARAAEAYIDCGQYRAARRVLEAAVKRVEDMPTVVRTKIELHLAEAHLHLKEGNYPEGISVLTKKCEPWRRGHPRCSQLPRPFPCS